VFVLPQDLVKMGPKDLSSMFAVLMTLDVEGKAQLTK
jgi:hypothetical protein